MRVLYVAPRYHTNQIPVMKGWLENGHEVLFLSQFAGTSEDYTILRPVILGYSALFETVMRIYVFLFCRNEKSAKKEYDLRIKAGFPPLGKAASYIRSFKPDLVIVRERSLYNVPFTLACRRRGIPCILYNQSPLWDKPDRDKDWKKALFLPFLPKVRMTPVYGSSHTAGVKKAAHSYYVPFVMEPCREREEKSYCPDGVIRLLCVARYEKRKRLFMLLEVVEDLLLQRKMRLEIVGEALDAEQKAYYGKLENTVREKGLQDQVILRKNLDREQLFARYYDSDIFILPSAKERASISQLEAMSCSLPVICSDTNGTACYVKHGKTGYLFQEDNREDLRKKIGFLAKRPEDIARMGRIGRQIVKEKYSFSRYYQAVCSIMEGI